MIRGVIRLPGAACGSAFTGEFLRSGWLDRMADVTFRLSTVVAVPSPVRGLGRIWPIVSGKAKDWHIPVRDQHPSPRPAHRCAPAARGPRHQYVAGAPDPTDCSFLRRGFLSVEGHVCRGHVCRNGEDDVGQRQRLTDRAQVFFPERFISEFAGSGSVAGEYD